MLPSVAWLVQPIGDAASWIPVMWVAVGFAAMAIPAFTWWVVNRLEALRKRDHDLANRDQRHELRLYLIEEKLGMPHPPDQKAP